MKRRAAVTSASLARLPERVRLRDDSYVVIRLLEPNDGPLVQAVFDGMGEEMRYRRFLGFKTRLSDRDLEALTSVNHHGHEALAALDEDTQAPVGIARSIREPERPDTAEASVAVVDAWQGRGLGAILMDRLVRRAQEEGLCRFTAVLLTGNMAMFHLFERAGAVRITARYGDTLELAVELPFATDAPREAIRAAAAGEVHG